MAQDFKASFIPQKNLSAERPKGPARVGLFMLVATIIFVISILLAGGVFAYKKVLENSLKNKEASLERAKEAFDPRLIEELVRIDKRIIATEDLIDSHIVISPIFDLLENLTLKNVRFEEMVLRIEQSGKASLKLNGQATSYASIVLQSEAFGKSRFLREQIFSNFDLNQQGNVSFNFSADIDRELINYRSSLNGI